MNCIPFMVKCLKNIKGTIWVQSVVLKVLSRRILFLFFADLESRMQNNSWFWVLRISSNFSSALTPGHTISLFLQICAQFIKWCGMAFKYLPDLKIIILHLLSTLFWYGEIIKRNAIGLPSFVLHWVTLIVLVG